VCCVNVLNHFPIPERKGKAKEKSVNGRVAAVEVSSGVGGGVEVSSGVGGGSSTTRGSSTTKDDLLEGDGDDDDDAIDSGNQSLN
jgi:hypothetical protein